MDRHLLYRIVLCIAIGCIIGYALTASANPALAQWFLRIGIIIAILLIDALLLRSPLALLCARLIEKNGAGCMAEIVAYPYREIEGMAILYFDATVAYQINGKTYQVRLPHTASTMAGAGFAQDKLSQTLREFAEGGEIGWQDYKREVGAQLPIRYWRANPRICRIDIAPVWQTAYQAMRGFFGWALLYAATVTGLGLWLLISIW